MRQRLDELLRAHRLAQVRVHACLTRKPAVVGKGVGAHGDNRRGRGILAIEAGGDVLLVSADPTVFPEMYAGVLDHARADSSFAAKVDAAARRILLLKADPTFSRAYSGLSFTHWQNAFQGWASGRAETDLAFDAAGRALMADDHDPSAHWAMGRALWLQERIDDLF